jgi:flavin-dependent dehydrogenase
MPARRGAPDFLRVRAAMYNVILMSTDYLRESYDVIIVGAGPAGLKCAERLGGSSYRVLAIERKDVIGPKVCAGGLTGLNRPLELPAEKALSFRTQEVVLNGRRYYVDLKNSLQTIDRQDLGNFQLGLLRRFENLTIVTGTDVKEISGSHITIKRDKKISFGFLVGADGANSLVRKHLGLRNKIYVGVHYSIPAVVERPVWLLDTELLGTGYGWIFPHRTFTSAGVFFNPRRISAEKAISALNTLLDEYGIDHKGAKLEGAPVNCLYRGVKFGNIFLTGDAAGLASAATGEGIPYALTSGEDVARHLLDNSYDFNNIKKILIYKKRQEHILSAFDTFRAYQPVLFRILVSLMKRPAFQEYFGV